MTNQGSDKTGEQKREKRVKFVSYHTHSIIVVPFCKIAHFSLDADCADVRAVQKNFDRKPA
jgi:hypothetical protein